MLAGCQSLSAQCLPLLKEGLKGEPYEKPWPKSQQECVIWHCVMGDIMSQCFVVSISAGRVQTSKHGRSSSRKQWARSSSATSASSASSGSSKSWLYNGFSTRWEFLLQSVEQYVTLLEEQRRMFSALILRRCCKTWLSGNVGMKLMQSNIRQLRIVWGRMG